MFSEVSRVPWGRKDGEGAGKVSNLCELTLTGVLGGGRYSSAKTARKQTTHEGEWQQAG